MLNEIIRLIIEDDEELAFYEINGRIGELVADAGRPTATC